MPDVPAAHDTFPEATRQFLPRHIAPAVRQITLIADLVEDDGLAIACAPGRRQIDVCVLNRAVRHPRLPVVVERVTVVRLEPLPVLDGTRMLGEVVLLNDLEQPI